MSDVEFVRVGSIRTANDTFRPKKAFRKDLLGFEPNLNYMKEVALKERNWAIVGNSAENETDRGDAIFCGLSKSGKTVTFKIGPRFYCVFAQDVIEQDKEFIGVHEVVHPKQIVRPQKKKK